MSIGTRRKSMAPARAGKAEEISHKAHQDAPRLTEITRSTSFLDRTVSFWVVFPAVPRGVSATLKAQKLDVR